MRTAGILLCFLLATCCGWAQDAAGVDTAARAAGPRISFATRSVDLGRFYADSIRECTFTFINDGDSTLVIAAVSTDCGCTTARHSADVIAPGASGEITVRFNGHGRRPGPFKKLIRIRSNAVNRPIERISITGMVKRDDRSW